MITQHLEFKAYQTAGGELQEEASDDRTEELSDPVKNVVEDRDVAAHGEPKSDRQGSFRPSPRKFN